MRFWQQPARRVLAADGLSTANEDEKSPSRGRDAAAWGPPARIFQQRRGEARLAPVTFQYTPERVVPLRGWFTQSPVGSTPRVGSIPSSGTSLRSPSGLPHPPHELRLGRPDLWRRRITARSPPACRFLREASAWQASGIGEGCPAEAVRRMCQAGALRRRTAGQTGTTARGLPC